MTIAQSTMHADVQSLNSLKSDVRSAEKGSLEEVAAQFESVFVQMMVKSMRDATMRSDLLQSNGMDTYQQMFDQQISVDLSRSGGLGLAQILVQQLSGNGAVQASGATAQHNASTASFAVPSEQKAFPMGDAARLRVGTPPPVAAPKPPVVDKTSTSSQVLAETPEEFVRKLWEPAVRAGKALNVAPEVLVAQSALETGWGQKVIRREDGSSSYNLFGIKADSRWAGESATVSTLEYEEGVARKEQAAFRAYDSLEQTFDDYVHFLQNNPRYGDALRNAGDSRAFVQGLQDAGYATDPRYADKVMAIVEGDRYGETINALKFSPQLPLES